MIIKTLQPKKMFKNNEFVDMHIHSEYSDGKNTVKEILEEANAKGIKVLSITDHNNFEAYKEINTTLKGVFKGKIYVGMEVNVFYKNYGLEVLAYGFDLSKLSNCKWFKKENNLIVQNERIKALIPFAKKYNLKYNPKNLKDVSTNGAYVFFEELLRNEENKNFFKKHKLTTPAQVYRKEYQNPKGLFFAGYNGICPSLEEMSQTIRNAGGYVVLAHPFNVYKYKNESKIAKELASLKLIDGIECYHKKFTKKDCNKAKKIAKKYNLIVTAGTDSHNIKKQPIGVVANYDVRRWIWK